MANVLAQDIRSHEISSDFNIATLFEQGKPPPRIEPGDLLRTTRIFPNWNLNCEVLISQKRHVCAAELRSLDHQGHVIFSWSITQAKNGMPLMILRLPNDGDRTNGIRVYIGNFETIIPVTTEQCPNTECRITLPFDDAFRALISTQAVVVFSFQNQGNPQNIKVPIAGLLQALEVAKTDPVGAFALTLHTELSAF